VLESPCQRRTNVPPFPTVVRFERFEKSVTYVFSTRVHSLTWAASFFIVFLRFLLLPTE
jgi:hypothetical protein